MGNYQTPRGTQDILPSEVSKWQKIERLIQEICYVYGYKEIRTPIFEETKVFKRENDSSDMVNKEMYTFTKNGTDSLTLRPEGTAGVVRSFVQHKMYGSQELPFKCFYMGEMFRYERPQRGRQRQFNQFGVENIGIKSPMIDVEVIALGYSIVKAMGLSSLKVVINTLGDDESRNRYREALKEHFAKDIQDMCPDCQRRYEQNPLRILDCKVDKDHPSMKSVPNILDYLTDESKEYFEQVKRGLEALGIPYEIDQRLVRGLDYYTHTVFEVISTHEESGSQSTVFAGGRYDGLVQYFGGPEMSGVGFAMGLERLMILAEAEGVLDNDDDGVDVYVMSLGDVKEVPLAVASMLRANGYVTEFNVQPKSLKAQFKAVDRKKAEVVVIVGEEELKDGEVNVKHIPSQTQVRCKLDEVVDVVDQFMSEDLDSEDHCDCGDEHCSCQDDHCDCHDEHCKCHDEHCECHKGE